MQIRDITATGYYARRAPERDAINADGEADGGLALDSVHIIGAPSRWP